MHRDIGIHIAQQLNKSQIKQFSNGHVHLKTLVQTHGLRSSLK